MKQAMILGWLDVNEGNLFMPIHTPDMHIYELNGNTCNCDEMRYLKNKRF